MFAADPERRIPLAASTRLWDAAVAVTGDDAFGIDVSRHVRSGTFHGLGHAFMTSPTLRAALERAARFSRVTADMAVSSTRVEGDEFVFVNGWREGVAAAGPRRRRRGDGGDRPAGPGDARSSPGSDARPS